MGESLRGLKDYLERSYNRSIFDEIKGSDTPWELHVHGQGIIVAKIRDNHRYDIALLPEKTHSESTIPKLFIKCLYPASEADPIRKLMKMDTKIKAKNLEPILSPTERHHVKNKSLYPFMMDREVLLFTLLGGELIKGIIGGFSRYEITVLLKGGLPVTIMRHGIYDIRDKKNRCFLKSYQQKHQDWKKSTHYEVS